MEHLTVELNAKSVKLYGFLHTLGLEVEKISDQGTYQLLYHDVLLEEIREKGIPRDYVSETAHYLVELAMIVQLLIETKILFLFKHNQIFAHP